MPAKITLPLRWRIGPDEPIALLHGNHGRGHGHRYHLIGYSTAFGTVTLCGLQYGNKELEDEYMVFWGQTDRATNVILHGGGSTPGGIADATPWLVESFVNCPICQRVYHGAWRPTKEDVLSERYLANWERNAIDRLGLKITLHATVAKSRIKARAKRAADSLHIAEDVVLRKWWAQQLWSAQMRGAWREVGRLQDLKLNGRPPF